MQTEKNRRNEILIELGLRAEVGQGRPKKNGEIISPLNTQQKQALAKPKTTKEIAAECGISERTTPPPTLAEIGIDKKL